MDDEALMGVSWRIGPSISAARSQSIFSFSRQSIIFAALSIAGVHAFGVLCSLSLYH